MIRDGIETVTASEVLLVGGGHSHAIVLNELRRNSFIDARITVVSDVKFSAYSGMLPGLIAGRFSAAETHIDIEQLTSLAGGRFVKGRVAGVDLKAKSLRLIDGSTLGFDILALNIGSTPPIGRIPGADTHTTPVKPVANFLNALEEIDKAQHDGQKFKICVVGGGAGGVELAFALRARFSTSSIQLIQADTLILPEHPEAARSTVMKYLLEAGIAVTTNAQVMTVEQGVLRLQSLPPVPFDWCVWATGSSAPDWIASSGLAHDTKGFVEVNESLQSTSHDFVFASGDAASIRGEPRPKSGVFAVRQGIPLYENLRRFLSGQKLKPYKFQRRFLTIIGTTPGRAVAARGNLVYEGTSMWKLKELIDKRFMRRFNLTS